MEVKIRELPEEIVVAIDEISARQGISREEYLRRMIQREVAMAGQHFVMDTESKIRVALTQTLERNVAMMELLIQVMEEKRNE